MSVQALPTRSLLVLGLAAAIAGCNADGIQDALSGDAATSGTILSILSQAQTSGAVQGVLTPGSVPSGMNASFDLTLTPSATAVTNGGTASVTLMAASPFTEVNVGGPGLEGFFLITLPSATTSVTIQVTVDQDYTSPQIEFAFSAGDGTDYGAIATQSFAVVVVGTGDVQVSLTFDQQDDVDLHVVDPNGDTVFFAMRTVPSGGMLDLDANPVCSPPHGNAENITWPEGSAPLGTYQVLIDLFASCFPNPVNYTLTISVVGSAPQILSGTLQPGDAGLGPQLITTFMVMAPPPPPMP
jgi:hypothetical protein